MLKWTTTYSMKNKYAVTDSCLLQVYYKITRLCVHSVVCGDSINITSMM